MQNIIKLSKWILYDKQIELITMPSDCLITVFLLIMANKMQWRAHARSTYTLTHIQINMSVFAITLSALLTQPYTCANSVDPDEPYHQDLHCLSFGFDF